MKSSVAESWYRIGVTIVVIVILGGQALTVPITAADSSYVRKRFYPIIDYPMYGPPHYENERVNALWVLDGVYQDGSKIALTRDVLGLTTWDFTKLANATVRKKPGGAEKLLEIVLERTPNAHALAALNISNYPVRVTRAGAETIPSELVMSIPLNRPE